MITFSILRHNERYCCTDPVTFSGLKIFHLTMKASSSPLLSIFGMFAVEILVVKLLILVLFVQIKHGGKLW